MVWNIAHCQFDRSRIREPTWRQWVTVLSYDRQMSLPMETGNRICLIPLAQAMLTLAQPRYRGTPVEVSPGSHQLSGYETSFGTA